MNKCYTLKYLPLFVEDLDSIVNYISEKLLNPEAANFFIDAVEKAILARSEYPLAFKPEISVKDRKTPYYRIFVDNFVIYYAVIDDVMEVRRILYGPRYVDTLV